jgi:hypothetical protein
MEDNGEPVHADIVAASGMNTFSYLGFRHITSPDEGRS